MRRRPEQAMMDDEQVRLGSDGEFHGGKTRVYGGGDAADRTGILDLQSVGRAVVIINFVCVKDFVAVSDDDRERNLWHGAMKSNFPPTEKPEAP